MKNPIAIELLKDCPPESLTDHTTIANAIERGDSRDVILDMPECDRWPETYVWLKSQLKNPAAVSLGKMGGSAKSAKKSVSSAANGAKGGRPRKTPPASE